MSKCICGRSEVSPVGDLKSVVAVVSDYPGFEEVRNGRAFTGAYGEAFRHELMKAGIQPESLFMFAALAHMPAKDCEHDWQTPTLKLLRNRKLIFMLGTQTLTAYAGMTTSECSGTIVKSSMLPDSIIVAGPSITTLGKMPLGELRLSIAKFAEQRRKLK